MHNTDCDSKLHKFAEEQLKWQESASISSFGGHNYCLFSQPADSTHQEQLDISGSVWGTR
jgi:hypothetical protein